MAFRQNSHESLNPAVNPGRKIKAGFRFLRSRFTANSAVLLYHRVAEPVRDPFRLCVTPENFAAHMERLRRFASPAGIHDFVRLLGEGRLPRRSVCVSFDDGYVDFREAALPVLERFEIPAVLYCVSGHLGEPFWWDRLLAGIFDPETPPDSLDFPASGGLTREKLFERLYPVFRDLPPGERERKLRELSRHGGPGRERTLPRLMTAGELEELSRHPLVTIGAHTITHSSLAGRSPAEQEEEIGGSCRQISDILGRAVTTFSYPFGLRGRDYDGETMEAVKRAGLDHALAADSGVVTAGADPFSLPRLWIHNTSGPAFERKIRAWL